MRTMCSREIFTKKSGQQQIFDSDLKGAWHYNHVTFTPIAKNFMLYCWLIYMLSILCVRLTIKVKVGIPESLKVGRYPPQKKLGRVTFIRPDFKAQWWACNGFPLYCKMSVCSSLGCLMKSCAPPLLIILQFTIIFLASFDLFNSIAFIQQSAFCST